MGVEQSHLKPQGCDQAAVLQTIQGRTAKHKKSISKKAEKKCGLVEDDYSRHHCKETNGVS